VGGSGVKVAARVGVSVPTPIGWKGVGVEDESGAGVTSTSDGDAPSAVGSEQAVSSRQVSRRNTKAEVRAVP
jgi:hypothetical protein